MNTDRGGHAGLAVLLVVTLAGVSRGQDTTVTKPAALDTTVAAGEADAQQPAARGLAKYNTFDFGFTTFRIGYGFLVDFATYSQDDNAKQQVVADPDVGLRDFRLLFKGKFKTQRPISWTMGIMYDGNTKEWQFRQTGLMIGVPEISSDFFIGRTKEGFSQYKVMVGYDIWTIERSPFLDAFIPILGDGIKWIGHWRRQRVMWDLGYYNDFISDHTKFATYDHQLVGRLVWLPLFSEERAELLHVAVMGRDTKPDEGSFRAKSKPESFLAPNFVDTDVFPTDHARTLGFEAWYRKGSLLYGGEYGWQAFDAPTVGDPMFHGGNVTVSWLITGETRGYNSGSGFFKAVIPKRTIFEGGPGAIEVSLNLSNIDLDDGTLQGGRFWRITPALKWHLMDYMRVELGYGYGVLEKNGLRGVTQFFQARLLTAL